METIDYSVIIRTTGNAHARYQALLDSIDRLTPRPAEVIVVLPEGYSAPPEKLGYETYYYSPKGMVNQRVAGITKCKTRYALICDDDVCFGPDFVQKLYKPLQEGSSSLSAGPLYSFLPPKGFKAVLCVLMASAMPTIFYRKKRYVSVLRSTGYSYNRHLDMDHSTYYESQSVAGTCFFADIQALLSVDFGAECWLDERGYSAMEDQTMFYKAWLQGHKTVVVSDAFYEHLDARTSTQNNKGPFLYASAFNRVVFWHRFIYSQENSQAAKCLDAICFGYYSLWFFTYGILGVFRKHDTKQDFLLRKKGYFDGWRFTKSKDYRLFPPVVDKK